MEPSYHAAVSAEPTLRGHEFLYTFNDIPQSEPEARAWYEFLQRRLESVYSRPDSPILYAVGQLERGGESGHYHAHIFVQYRVRQRCGKLRLLLAGRFKDHAPHIDVPRKPALALIRYCQKEETRVAGPFELGENRTNRTGQGTRTDLNVAADAIRSGASLREIVEKNLETFVKYHKGIERSLEILRRPALTFEPPKVFVLWGKSGVGKTRAVYRLAGDDLYVVRHSESGDPQRFHDFDPVRHKHVLFDEFRGGPGQLSFDAWKEFCSEYPYRSRTFGGESTIRPETIWFCSNYDPETWWNGIVSPRYPVENEAFVRRITKVTYAASRSDIGAFEAYYREAHGSDAPGTPAAPPLLQFHAVPHAQVDVPEERPEVARERLSEIAEDAEVLEPFDLAEEQWSGADAFLAEFDLIAPANDGRGSNDNESGSRHVPWGIPMNF